MQKLLAVKFHEGKRKKPVKSLSQGAGPQYKTLRQSSETKAKGLT